MQFHGEEDAGYCRGWGVKVIKAFRLKERTSLDQLGRFFQRIFISGFLFGGVWRFGDGVSVGMARWARCLQADSFGRPRVDNVAAAIDRVHPFGVDVCSGVEARPGIKDHGKLKEFIVAAKSA